MKTIYLDQNKWIELTAAAANPQAYHRQYETLLALTEAEAAGRIQVPLTFSNIYEAQKIGDPGRRARLALVMCNLGWGRVFRSRSVRLTEEVRSFLATHAGGQRQNLANNWFVSDNFLEASLDLAVMPEGIQLSEALASAIVRAPHAALRHYLTSIRDDERVSAVQHFSQGLLSLAGRMEQRRLKWSTEPLHVRRRAYGALLLLEDADTILTAARSSGLPWTNITEPGSSLVKHLLTDVPTFDVERELAIRLEAQAGAITENDIRDMANFVAAIPYSDIVVAEKHFINLTRQSKLGTKYDTTLLSDLADLRSEL